VKKRAGKPTSPIVLAAAVLAGVLAVGAGGYFLLVRPKANEAKTLKAQAKSVQADIDAKRAQTAAVASAPRIKVADLYRLAKAMPTSADMPDVLLELNQLARDTGIVFDTISPQPLVALQGYSAMPISVTFDGTFYDLADLLYRVRSLVNVRGLRLDATGRLFAIDSITFGQGPRGFPQIHAALTIDAFVYGSATGVAAAAPAAAPPATDTTSTTSTTTPTSTDSGTASAAGAP
jgi:Tfp pilus assembly protein PilO